MQLTVSGVKKEYEEGITLPKLFEIENVETPEYVTVSSPKNSFQEPRKKHTS